MSYENDGYGEINPEVINQLLIFKTRLRQDMKRVHPAVLQEAQERGDEFKRRSSIITDDPNQRQVEELHKEVREQNDDVSMVILGRLYYRWRDPVKRDRSQAVRLFQEAAIQGNRDAMVELGNYYLFEYESGINRDVSKAMMYFYTAACLGSKQPMVMWRKPCTLI